MPNEITCSRCGHCEPAPIVTDELLPLPRLRAEPEPEPEPENEVETVDGFCRAFSDLVMTIPPSVRAKVTTKLARCGIDASAETDDVRTVLEAACKTYAKKKEAARLASAKRRADKKAAITPVPAMY